LLRTSGRNEEARRVLERGAELGETEILFALGNLYACDFDEPEAAETAYRADIAAGDLHCHNNLGSLLLDRDDLEGAEAEFRLGAEAGDALAARNLRSLLDDDENDDDGEV
jgi:hypothetical protein